MIEFPQIALPGGPPAFEQFIAPLTRERFLAEFWEKKFLHLSGVRGRFTPLLPWEELNEILEWHSPPQPAIRLYLDGKAVDPQRYIEGPPGGMRLNAGGLIASLSHASLIMDSVQEAAPRVAGLAGMLQDVLDGAPIVNLYASWGRQKAFDLHWDPQEVFILQLSGRKHWKVFAPTRPYPLRDDTEAAPRPTGEPVWDGILEDGDMLYMPRGWWHMAQPLDEPSLHLNFAIEPPNGDDFLRWLIPKLWSHPEIRQNLPHGCDSSGRRDYFAGLLQVMERGLDRDRVGEFLREWNAFRRTSPRVRLPQAPMEQKMPFSMATRIRLAAREGLCVACESGARIARLQAGGVTYNIPPALIPAFERLSGRASIPLAELCAGIGDQHLVGLLVTTLDQLAASGVILKEAPAAH